jgi:hypothetical protein
MSARVRAATGNTGATDTKQQHQNHSSAKSSSAAHHSLMTDARRGSVAHATAGSIVTTGGGGGDDERDANAGLEKFGAGLRSGVVGVWVDPMNRCAVWGQ